MFTQLQIAPDPVPVASFANKKPVAEDKVEITLTNGRRLNVSATIDGAALSRLLRVLDRA